MKLEHLRIFAAVAVVGELAEAAAQVGRTPAAVSMTLRQIEDDLGSPLFEGGRKSRLTPLGNYVFERARRALSEYDSALLNIRHFARGEHGVVSLAAVPSAATRLVPIAFAELRKQRPHARIELRDIDSAAVVEAVVNGEADFGIASDSPVESGLLAELLLEDPFVLVCPAGHRFAVASKPINWSDIDPAEFIANGVCSRAASPELRALAAQSPLMLHNTASLFGFVAQGFGITVLPALAAPESGTFRTLPLADGTLCRRLNLLTRQGESLKPLSQALLESVREVAIRFASIFANR